MRDSKSDFTLTMNMEYKRLTDILGSGRNMLYVKPPEWFVLKVRDAMKPDTVVVGKSKANVDWVFVQPSEGFAEAAFGDAETQKHRMIMKDEKLGTFKDREVQIHLWEGPQGSGEWSLDVVDDLAYVLDADN